MRCHLLPRALTDYYREGFFIESGEFGRKPIRRNTSWYDAGLVTREGEAILARYDDLAVKFFAEYRLCWRYRPNGESPRFSDSFKFGTHGIARIDGADSKRLRRFFLSLLWRAAESSIAGMKDIKIDTLSRHKLRRIVAGEIDGLLSDFPVVLTFIEGVGEPHNLTPLMQKVQIPQIVPGLVREVPIVRFFLDGLVAHIGRKKEDKIARRYAGGRAVGDGDSIILATVPWDISFEKENLGFLKVEAERDWPDLLRRLHSASARAAAKS